MTELFKLENAEVVLQKPLGQKIDKKQNVELVHLTLQPKEQIPLHANPFDVFFHVVAGSGILKLEDDEKQISASDTAFIPKAALRGLHNIGTEELKVLVVKVF
ncbi:MAG: cupin domain-containing protein [Bacteroidota bacterium]